ERPRRQAGQRGGQAAFACSSLTSEKAEPSSQVAGRAGTAGREQTKRVGGSSLRRAVGRASISGTIRRREGCAKQFVPTPHLLLVETPPSPLPFTANRSVVNSRSELTTLSGTVATRADGTGTGRD